MDAPVMEASASSAGTSPPRKRGRGRARRGAKAEQDAEEKPVVELPTGWAALPLNILTEVYKWLDANVDVIAAGQTCQLWRAAAKLNSVWRERCLSYDVAAASASRPGSSRFQDWHAGAKVFARTIRFAPCLARVSCAKSMKPAARSAIATKSSCKVKSAVLNGQVKWTEKYISRQKSSLVQLTILNPSLDMLKTALGLPHLASLAVSYERDTTKEAYQQRAGYFYMGGSPPQRYQVPTLPGGTTGKLKKLTCHPGVRPAAVEALVLANAATVEEVGVHCFPLEPLLRCSRLRRLLVRLAPADAADQGRLRQLLEGRAQPLEYLAFLGTRSHAKAPCKALRDSLRGRVQAEIVCQDCDNACVQERPTFASRDVPAADDDDDGEFDFLANMFRTSGPCRCISCCSQEDYSGDEDYFDDY